jgi:hypothetical protein
MKALPRCPEKLPVAVGELISALGQTWRESSERPRIEDSVLDQWSELVSSWANDSTLPLLVRKSSLVRGSELQHVSGRIIVPCDNSPAQWACHLALRGNVPTLEEIRAGFRSDLIPVSFAHKSGEHSLRRFHCTLRKHTVNKAGWKLCHIDPVGLRSRIPLREVPIEVLKRAFFDLLDPKNFFVLPITWGGLGEAPEFIRAFARAKTQF